MTEIDIEGIRIAYELLGERGKPAVAITPGGRFSKDSPGVRECGEALAAGGRRVLLWDRPNCGASDLCFRGEGEAILHADVLTQLIRKLNLGPTALAGGSAGSRVSLLAALRNPETVSHVIPWWISGGLLGLIQLGAYYCSDAAVLARNYGMWKVAEQGIWAEQLERNPRNRDILLSQAPETFVATMEQWVSGYVATEETPVPGLPRDKLARITQPTLIFRSSPTDIWHPQWITDWVHKHLPNSEYVDAPWPDDIFARRMNEGNGLFVDWPLAVPAILEFTARQRIR